MPILTVEKLTKSFGGLMAVSNVNMHLNQGEMVGLIGPNGAGKTTVFNLLTGVYKPSSGVVTLERDGKARPEALQHLQAGPGPYLSEHPSVQGPDRTG